MLDSPTNNFCTWNPVSTRESYIGTLSEGNLRYNPYGATMSEPNGMKGTLAVNSGKWYFEVGRRDTGNDYHTCISGVVNDVRKYFTLYSGNYYYSPEGNSSIGQASPGTDGQISGCAFDLENNKIWFAVNGTWTNSGNPSNNTGGFPLTAGLTEVSIFTEHPNGSYDGDDIMNCGQDSSFQGLKTSGSAAAADGNSIGDFYYAPPTGFLALCTSNLPDVAVVPSEHFNTVAYTLSGGSYPKSVTGVGFQPDLIWQKSRTQNYGHYLFDVIRGVGTASLASNSTGAEGADSGTDLDSFDADGFTVGGGDAIGDTSGVVWNWKANGSGSSNTDGSINTTKTSANVDAGFSMVTYTGNVTEGATVGHGLSKAPELMFVKRRNVAGGWMTYSAATGATKTFTLNTTEAAYTSAGIWNNTAPTADVFSLGSNGATNANGGTYLAYCFHSVDGYSKVGSYSGNSSTDGTFVYTGFRPAFVMIKASSHAGHWVISNNKSTPYNVVNKGIIANDSAGEYTDPNLACLIDYTSNGFKWRNSDDNNNLTGRTYIYIAFAETPFKYSNAR